MADGGSDPTAGARETGTTASDADNGVEFAVLGDPGDGATLDLDHERFAYAGKFVTSSTGKAVARATGRSGGADGGDEADVGEVLAAASFDRDRTDPSVVRIRYVTVRRDRRGEGIGACLLDFVARYALGGAEQEDVTGIAESTDVVQVLIAVNNPFAYEAAYRARFGYTGEQTGIAELVLARPGDRSSDAYRRGLSAFRERDDLDEAARAFLDARREAGPPEPVGSAEEGD